jgi:hypothetical protein
MRASNSILSLSSKSHSSSTAGNVDNIFARTITVTGHTKQSTQVVSDKSRSRDIARLGAIADYEGGNSDDELDVVIDPEKESSILSNQKVGGNRYDGSVVVPNPIKLHTNVFLNAAKAVHSVNSSINAVNDPNTINNNAKRTSKLGQVGAESHVTLTNTQLEYQQESVRRQLAEQHQSNRNQSSVSNNKPVSSNIGVSAVGRNFRMVGTVLQDMNELMKNAANYAKIQEEKAQSKAATSDSELLKKRARDDEIDALLAKKSAHENEAENAIFDRFNKECDKYAAMEKKAVAQSKVKSIKIRACYCEDCKLLTEKAVDLCRIKGHRQVMMNTVKKFFECKKCYKREFILGDAMFPKKRCQVCNAYEWVSCGISGSTALDGRADEGIVSAFSEYTSKKERRRIGEMVSRLE